jgi:hypothetical protein
VATANKPIIAKTAQISKNQRHTLIVDLLAAPGGLPVPVLYIVYSPRLARVARLPAAVPTVARPSPASSNRGKARGSWAS